MPKSPCPLTQVLYLLCGLLMAAVLQACAQKEDSIMNPPQHRASLYDAAVFNDRAAVEQFLARDPASINAGDANGFVPLHGVVGEHHVAMARLLIARGANVNAVNDQGTTPLHLAAYPEMAELLVQAGAWIESPDRQGNTPLHSAAEHPEMIDVMEKLLALGAKPNAQNHAGQTPLDIALQRGEDDKITSLKQAGAHRGQAMSTR